MSETLQTYLTGLGVSPGLARRIVLTGGLSLARDADSLHARYAVHGLDQATAARIAAALAAAAVVNAAANAARGRQYARPDIVAAELQTAIGASAVERFAVVGLDSRLRQRYIDVVAVGSMTEVTIHPRNVFRAAILRDAYAVILAHNHPSDDPSPSDADVELTERFVSAGRMIGIPIVDHLIVTPSGEHCSLASLGLVGSL